MFPFGHIYPVDRELPDHVKDISLVCLVPQQRSLFLQVNSLSQQWSAKKTVQLPQRSRSIIRILYGLVNKANSQLEVGLCYSSELAGPWQDVLHWNQKLKFHGSPVNYPWHTTVSCLLLLTVVCYTSYLAMDADEGK